MGETTTNNDLLKKIAATVTEPHHHIIVTYEEDSDIEVDGVAILVGPLVDFLLTTGDSCDHTRMHHMIHEPKPRWCGPPAAGGGGVVKNLVRDTDPVE